MFTNRLFVHLFISCIFVQSIWASGIYLKHSKNVVELVNNGRLVNEVEKLGKGYFTADTLDLTAATCLQLLDIPEKVIQKMDSVLFESFMVPCADPVAQKRVRLPYLEFTPEKRGLLKESFKRYTRFSRYKPFGETLPASLETEFFGGLDVISMLVSYPEIKTDKPKLAALFGLSSLPLRKDAPSSDIFLNPIMEAKPAKKENMVDWMRKFLDNEGKGIIEALQRHAPFTNIIEEFKDEYGYYSLLYKYLPRLVSQIAKRAKTRDIEGSLNDICPLFEEALGIFTVLLKKPRFRYALRRTAPPELIEEFGLDTTNSNFFTDVFSAIANTLSSPEHKIRRVFEIVDSLESRKVVNVDNILAGIDTKLVPEALLKVVTLYIQKYFEFSLVNKRRIVGAVGKALLKGIAMGRSYKDPDFVNEIAIAALVEHGPALLKLLQMVGDQSNDPEVRRLLSCFKDDVKRMNRKDLEHQLEVTYGRDFAKIFSASPETNPTCECFPGTTFAIKPISKGTVGQCHPAIFNGKRLMIKVKRRDLVDQVNDDYRILTEVFDPAKGGVNLGQKYLDELYRELLQETDYQHEIDCINLGQKIYGGRYRNIRIVEYVNVPRHGDECFAMSTAPGITVKKFLNDSNITMGQLSVVDSLIRDLLMMWLGEGLLRSHYFHADPHSGNLMINYTDRAASFITLIDFGSFNQIPPATTEKFVLNIFGLVLNSTELILEGLGYNENNPAWGPFKNELDSAFKGTSFTEIAKRSKAFSDILGRHVVLPRPPHFVQFMRAFSLITNIMDDIGRKMVQLDPNASRIESTNELVRLLANLLKGFIFNSKNLLCLVYESCASIALIEGQQVCEAFLPTSVTNSVKYLYRLCKRQ